MYQSESPENFQEFKRRGDAERVRIDFNAEIRVFKKDEMEIKITKRNYNFPNNVVNPLYFKPLLRQNSVKQGEHHTMILELTYRDKPNPVIMETSLVTVLKVQGNFSEFVQDEPYIVFLRWSGPMKWTFSMIPKSKQVTQNSVDIKPHKSNKIFTQLKFSSTNSTHTTMHEKIFPIKQLAREYLGTSLPDTFIAPQMKDSDFTSTPLALAVWKRVRHTPGVVCCVNNRSGKNFSDIVYTHVDAILTDSSTLVVTVRNGSSDDYELEFTVKSFSDTEKNIIESLIYNAQTNYARLVLEEQERATRIAKIEMIRAELFDV